MFARWSVPAAILTLLAASMPAYAQPSSQSPWSPTAPPSGVNSWAMAPPPPPQPWLQPEPREVWYGWKTLIVAGASVTTGVVPYLIARDMGAVLAMPLGVGGLVFGGPIVHWTHGRIGRGFAVLGMNLGAAATGFGIFALPVACVFEKCDGAYFTYGVVGSYVGAAVGMIIDVAALSTYRPPVPPDVASTPRLLDSLAPVIDVRKGRTVLGLSGAF
jgi:hypothetical protein